MSTIPFIKRGAVTLGCAVGLLASMTIQAEEKLTQNDQDVKKSEVQTVTKTSCAKTLAVKEACSDKTTLAMSTSALKVIQQAKQTWMRKIGHAAHIQAITESDFTVRKLNSSLLFASGPELP